MMPEYRSLVRILRLTPIDCVHLRIVAATGGVGLFALSAAAEEPATPEPATPGRAGPERTAMHHLNASPFRPVGRG